MGGEHQEFFAAQFGGLPSHARVLAPAEEIAAGPVQEKLPGDRQAPPGPLGGGPDLGEGRIIQLQKNRPQLGTKLRRGIALRDRVLENPPGARKISRVALGDRFVQRRGIKVRPQCIGEIKLSIGQLPQQEIADALLAAGADEQVRLGRTRRRLEGVLSGSRALGHALGLLHRALEALCQRGEPRDRRLVPAAAPDRFDRQVVLTVDAVTGRAVLGKTRSGAGPEHADVASVLNNLAVFYTNERRFTEAERTHLRALAKLMEECGIRTTKNPAEMGKLLKSVLK